MTPNHGNVRGKVVFAVIMVAVVAIWGWLLPALSETNTVRSRDRWLDEHQIDPAAMFYTDLPIPESVLQSER